MNTSPSPRIKSQDKSPQDKALNPIFCFYENTSVSEKKKCVSFENIFYYSEEELKVTKKNDL